MESTSKQIKNKILKSRRGKLFFPDDFAALGTPDAIRLALGKLQKSGLLVRLAHGIYYYPKINTNKYIKSKYLMPSIDDIAYAISKRDKIRIMPTGVHALNVLGLSTQVPANAVFVTDGAPRRITVGKGKGILFKHTSNTRSLAYKSKRLMLIVSALREIGEGKVTDEQLAIIKTHFSHISKKEFETDVPLMPLWVRQILWPLYESE